MEIIDQFDFMHNGREFTARVCVDEDMGAPWAEHDFHGVISEYTSRAKRPGERVLCEDRGYKRFYDVQESMRKAMRDGWGRHIDGQTKRQATAAAVDADFERMRGWCNDEWCWVGVSVTATGEEDNYSNALWGIESDSPEYHKEVARELADEVPIPETQSEDCGV